MIFDAILNGAPPSIVAVNPRFPVELDRVVNRLLEKDRELRYQSASDLRSDLKRLRRDSSGKSAAAPALPSAPAPRAFSGARRHRLIAAAIITLAAAAWIAYRATWPAPLKPLVRLVVDLGPNVSLGSSYGPGAMLSPDGSRLIYASRGRLFARRLELPTATELAGSEGAYAPFFSPDGEWVAFFAGGKLKKLSLEGGAPAALCDAPLGPGGSWGADGSIIAALFLGRAAVAHSPRRRRARAGDVLGARRGDAPVAANSARR